MACLKLPAIFLPKDCWSNEPGRQQKWIFNLRYFITFGSTL